MKENTKRLLIIFSICLNFGFIIMAVYTVMSEKKPHHLRKSRFYRHEKLFEKVAMNEGQKKEVKELVSNYVSANKGIQTSAAKVKLDLYALLEKPGQPDKSALKNYIDRLQELGNKKEYLKFQHLLDIRKTLTDEQAKKFFLNLSEVKQKRFFKHNQKTK